MPSLDDLAAWLPLLFKGLVVTIQLTVVSGVIAAAVSFALAVLRLSPWLIARLFAGTYVELFRSIPLLALLLFVYYGLGPVAGELGLTAFWLAVIALVLNDSAYLAEVYRGALEAVPASQREAAASLGLSWAATMRRVIVPQALLPSVPSTLIMVISLIKNSSLAALITVGEVTLTAQGIVFDTFRPVAVYLVLALLYLAMVVPLTIVAGYFERKVRAQTGE